MAVQKEKYLDKQIKLYKRAVILVIVCVIALTACGHRSDREELEKYIAELKSKPPQPIAPLPAIKTPLLQPYIGGEGRSPFTPTSVQGIPKQPLEAYPVDSLKLVGVLNEKNTYWALIMAPNGLVYRATIGDHLGQNSGVITNISSQSLELEERIPDSAGWHSKRSFMRLWSSQGT